jgi:hypothetical protein
MGFSGRHRLFADHYCKPLMTKTGVQAPVSHSQLSMSEDFKADQSIRLIFWAKRCQFST